MVFLIVLVTFVVFVVVDLAMRLALKRIDETRLRKRRRAALDLALKIDVADEAKSLKRVEVENPKARILAVDDEPIILDSFRKILVLEGYSVDTVETGPEALGLVQKKSYDFLFTDLKMPGMDGLDVTKAAKHLRPDIDVVMITGYATVESAVDAMRYGALDYVEKPFAEDELTAFVNKCLIRRQDRLEKEQPPRVLLVTTTRPEEDSPRVFNVPAGVFISPAHVWIRIEKTGEVRAGIDDFARKTIDKIDAITMPKVGRRINKGQPLFKVNQETRSVAFPAPLTGVISAVNEELLHHVDYVSVNPYEIGWICRLVPKDLSSELEELRIGRAAVAWYEGEIEKLRKAASERENDPDAGGADRMSDELWDSYSHSFFGA